MRCGQELKLVDGGKVTVRTADRPVTVPVAVPAAQDRKAIVAFLATLKGS